MRKSLASLALCMSLAACGGDDEFIPPVIDAAVDAVEIDAVDAQVFDAPEFDAPAFDAPEEPVAGAIAAIALATGRPVGEGPSPEGARNLK